MRSSRTSAITATTISILFLISTTANAFGGATTDIKIVGLPGGAEQSLPAQYVKSIKRWNIQLPKNEIDGPTTATLMPGTDHSSNDSFVDPSTTTHLWWPADIAKLQVRPTFDVLLQRGSPTYAFAGLNVRVPPEAASNNVEWRNYGLNSQPLARQWTTFSFAVDPAFRVECFVGRKEVDDAEDEWEWNKLGDDDSPVRVEVGRMQSAIESLGIFLSSLDESSALSEGFNIISCPLSDTWVDLQKPPVINGETSAGYKIVCFATAEPDAEELLNLGDSLIALSATSVLKVDVSSTESGSESQYLPDAYKPLYLSQEF